MSIIYATRTSGDLYDVTFSDDASTGRMTQFDICEIFERDTRYAQIQVLNQLEGETKPRIISRAGYNPDKSLLSQGAGTRG